MATEIQAILQQALQRSTKSTALKPLGGLIVALFSACILSSRYGLDSWLVTMFGILAIITVVIFLGIYLFFAFTNPDQLRSEKYIIQKTAIQHGFIGDDTTGYVRFTKIGDNHLLTENNETGIQKGGK